MGNMHWPSSAVNASGRGRIRARLLLVLITVTLTQVIIGGVASTDYLLTIDRPLKSDLILVLGGHENPLRVRKAMQLLRNHYGRYLVIDADAVNSWWGITEADLIRTYIAQTDARLAPRIIVCPTTATSTRTEVGTADSCLSPLNPQRVLLVTSDYHTRRALSIFKRGLPQYDWSIVGVQGGADCGMLWWRNPSRVLAIVKEWVKLAYWELVTKWSTRPHD
jgi:uncharacterized SAM-binding protein YcdF (DUF218 family)